MVSRHGHIYAVFHRRTCLDSPVWRGASFLPPLKSLPGLLLMGAVGIGFNNVLQFAGLGISTVINCTLIAAPRTGTYRFYGCGLSERTPECRCVGRDYTLLCRCLVDYLPRIIGCHSHGFLQSGRCAVPAFGDCLGSLRIDWRKSHGPYVRAVRNGLVRLFRSDLRLALWHGNGKVPSRDSDRRTMAVLFLYCTFWRHPGHAVLESRASYCRAESYAIFQNIMPLIGMLGAVICFHETIGLLELAGAAAIFTGVYLTTHFGKR